MTRRQHIVRDPRRRITLCGEPAWTVAWDLEHRTVAPGIARCDACEAAVRPALVATYAQQRALRECDVGMWLEVGLRFSNERLRHAIATWRAIFA